LGRGNQRRDDTTSCFDASRDDVLAHLKSIEQCLDNGATGVGTDNSNDLANMGQVGKSGAGTIENALVMVTGLSHTCDQTWDGSCRVVRPVSPLSSKSGTIRTTAAEGAKQWHHCLPERCDLRG
jgi:hypothetical protein